MTGKNVLNFAPTLIGVFDGELMKKDPLDYGDTIQYKTEVGDGVITVAAIDESEFVEFYPDECFIAGDSQAIHRFTVYLSSSYLEEEYPTEYFDSCGIKANSHLDAVDCFLRLDYVQEQLQMLKQGFHDRESDDDTEKIIGFLGKENKYGYSGRRKRWFMTHVGNSIIFVERIICCYDTYIVGDYRTKNLYRVRLIFSGVATRHENMQRWNKHDVVYSKVVRADSYVEAAERFLRLCAVQEALGKIHNVEAAGFLPANTSAK